MRDRTEAVVLGPQAELSNVAGRLERTLGLYAAIHTYDPMGPVTPVRFGEFYLAFDTASASRAVSSSSRPGWSAFAQTCKSSLKYL